MKFQHGEESNGDLTRLANVIQNSVTDDKPKTILITGCSSGIGLCAAKILRLANPLHRLILVARTMEKAKLVANQVDEILLSSSSSTKKRMDLIPMECNQSCLSSVRTFCHQLHELNHQINDNDNDGLLDVVCLNAALILPHKSIPQFTKDGIEMAFQTNHLAPFLIVNLIHDLLRPASRIVISSSGLHNGPIFNQFSGILDHPPFQQQQDDVGDQNDDNQDNNNTELSLRSKFEMINGANYQNKAAYAMSKLCNTTFCIELNHRLEQQQQDNQNPQQQQQNKKKKKIVANCFTPGLIPTSGLFRHGGILLPIFQFAMNSVLKVGSTLEWGGGALAWMALSDDAGQDGGQFYSTPPGSTHHCPTYGKSFSRDSIPTEATDVENRRILWDISSRLCGIKNNIL